MWSSDMKAEISTVVDEYLPGIMTAQERIEDADGADAESLEAAKTAMIVEYVDELERLLHVSWLPQGNSSITSSRSAASVQAPV